MVHRGRNDGLIRSALESDGEKNVSLVGKMRIFIRFPFHLARTFYFNDTPAIEIICSEK